MGVILLSQIEGLDCTGCYLFMIQGAVIWDQEELLPIAGFISQQRILSVEGFVISRVLDQRGHDLAEIVTRTQLRLVSES